MTLATIRELVRRRLNDVPADNWSDSILLDCINVAYAEVQKLIRNVDREALIFWDQRDTVAGTSWYEKPAGARGIAEVGLKKTSSDTDWTPLERRAYHVARDVNVEAETVYCHRGQYIGIFPAPTVSVTGGLQFLTSPTDQLSDDNDVPKIELTLHMAIVAKATAIAKGESPESDSKDMLEFAAMTKDIESDYSMPDLSQPIPLSADVSDARGRGSSTLSTPGVDRR